jgi:hypothetical protein
MSNADFHICPRCGAEFNRRDEWSMLELLPEHNFRHEQADKGEI